MKWALILAGIAGAVAYYLYSQMSEEEKTDMVDKVKEKGKQVYDKYVPDNMKNIVPGKA
jgi:lipopolysaccharide export system protein LptC